jgi:flagellar biosynthesis/type III secretory pathway M-ring protein FliF/YscJ
LVPEAALATAETRSIIPRGRVVVVTAAVVALLMLAAWVLWRPVIHKAARPSSPATTAVEATPPPAAAAAPVVPAACHSRTDSHSGSNACEQVGGFRRGKRARRSKQNYRQDQQTPRSWRAI